VRNNNNADDNDVVDSKLLFDRERAIEGKNKPTSNLLQDIAQVTERAITAVQACWFGCGIVRKGFRREVPHPVLVLKSISESHLYSDL
jgi:hypothetical protein